MIFKFTWILVGAIARHPLDLSLSNADSSTNSDTYVDRSLIPKCDCDKIKNKCDFLCCCDSTCSSEKLNLFR